MAYEPQVFRLGLTMAGAISAGAYTAGVMDYLLETFTKWEKAKLENDPLAPPHQVIIDAIGGASAGGITAALGGIALFDKIQPVKEIPDGPSGNLFYDSWVTMADDNRSTTFEKMLSSKDLESQQILSLLNSDCIDDIADRALQVNINELPSYVAKDLNLILTLTSLRGIPLKIDFRINKDLQLKNYPKSPAHKMSMHKLVAHFRTQPKANQTGDYLPFRPDQLDDRKLLLACAKATAAFPIGLKSRYFDQKAFTKKYLSASVQRLLRNEQGLMPQIVEEELPEIFDFTAVDGGTLNNEPFGEIADLLESKFREETKGLSKPPKQKNYGILMIDPFPNFNIGPSQSSFKKEQILQVVPALIGTLRAQGMVKENEIMDILSGNYPRAMVFPTRYENGNRVPDDKAIACSCLGGFGGFISRDFRIHDFFIGRENCRNFLETFFSFKETDQHPIHQNWTDEMKSAFEVHIGGEKYLPIIPNMQKVEDLREGKVRTSEERKSHAIAFDSLKISPNDIFKYKNEIHDRVKSMLSMLAEMSVEEKNQDEIDALIEEEFKPGFMARVGGWFASPIKSITQSAVVNKIIPNLATKSIIKAILKALHEHGLLKTDPK